MNKRINKGLDSKFIKNVIIMLTGTVGAQVVLLALSPVITRLYGPEAFGIMGTFNSMINIIVPIAALTYPVAIVLPKSEEKAKYLIFLSLLISILISVFSLIVITVFNKQIVSLLNLHAIDKYLYFIPLVIIFSALMQVSEQWLNRTNQFSINARVTFLQSLIVNGSKVGVGIYYPYASVLVFFSVLANGIKAVMMIILAKKPFKISQTMKKNNLKETIKLARNYSDFPLYRAPEVFINAVSNSLPVLLLTSFFGVTAAGFYTIGRTVLSIPSRLIGKAVGDVFYPHISEAARDGKDVTRIIKKATLALCGIGIIPFASIVLFGPSLFIIVFGSEWGVAGDYSRWIALWSFFAFINRPSVHALPVLNAQKFHLIYTIIMLIVRIAALATGFIVFNSDIVSVALFGIVGAILNIGLIIITLKISAKVIVKNS